MNAHEWLLTRRTIHDYTTQPVPEEVVLRALEAANHAPCHKLTWPWRFIQVGPATRQVLVALNARLKGAVRPLGPEQQERMRLKLTNPSHLLVVTQVSCEQPFQAREDYAAVACAIQNLSLSLHAEGVGSKWSTGGVTRHAETYAALGVDAASEEIVGFVWVGYAAVVPPTPPRREVQSLLRTVP